MAEKKPVQILSTKFPPPCKMPELDYPITPKENLKLLFEHKKPMWVPNSNRDLQPTAPPNDMERPPNGKDGYDWFGQKWTYIDVVGGNMIAPDSWKIRDIYHWEKELKFPNLDDYDFTVGREEEEKRLDRTRMIRYGMGSTLFERLMDITDTAEGLCFMAEEPESAAALFSALTDFRIKVVDKLVKEWVPVDVITVADDWGTQLSSFMSPDTYRKLIFPQMKRLFDHIRSRGIYPALHSCGRLNNLVPVFADLGAAFWEAQDINDLQWIKNNYGDKINFRLVFNRPMMETPGVTDDEVREEIKKFVTTLGKGGGLIANIWSPDPHVYTFTIEEMFRFSREYYAQN